MINSLKNHSVFILYLGLSLSGSVLAEDQGQRVPDEFESSGGLGLGLGNSGTASDTGLAAVRNNPAMLALEKQYSVSAGYHWPSVGREFWQAGAVDSKTSRTSAGLLYSTGKDKYVSQAEVGEDEANRFKSYYDSPIKFRAAGALAQQFANMAVGLGVGYVEGYQPENEKDLAKEPELVKGVVFGFGVAGLLSPALRFSASVENFNNNKLKDLAPKTWRAGVSWNGLYPGLLVNADYRQRDRVLQERLVSRKGELNLAEDGQELSRPEKMVTGSFSMAFQKAFRLLGAYGQDISGTGRKSISGGIALVNQAVSLSYLVGKPYMTDKRIHQAVNLSMQVSI